MFYCQPPTGGADYDLCADMRARSPAVSLIAGSCTRLIYIYISPSYSFRVSSVHQNHLKRRKYNQL